MTEERGFSLRPYRPADEDHAITLWQRTWQAAYPEIDFAGRVDWWRRRWRDELVPGAAVVVAEAAGALIGFVTIDPRSLYLDQIVVAPEYWGSGAAVALVDAAKGVSPHGLDLDVNTDNARAMRFYKKCGFVISGTGKNPQSGRPVYRMRWRP